MFIIWKEVYSAFYLRKEGSLSIISAKTEIKFGESLSPARP